MFRLKVRRIVSWIASVELFRLCLSISVLLHGAGYAAYLISTAPGEAVSSDELQLKDVEVDFEDFPPELLGGTGSPAPIDKKEWIEGSGKNAPDAAEDDVDFNALSGDGTDRDGYLYSFHGDRPPTPIINFDLKSYFPKEARRANITRKTVTVLIQVDEYGKLQSARIVSGRAGYGFDEAAMAIVNRARFAPGYIKGRPTKMNHRLPVTFVLED